MVEKKIYIKFLMIYFLLNHFKSNIKSQQKIINNIIQFKAKNIQNNNKILKKILKRERYRIGKKKNFHNRNKEEIIKT